MRAAIVPEYASIAWLFIASVVALGCSSETTVTDSNCSGSQVNNFIQKGNVEVLVGKTYSFFEGSVFHPDLGSGSVDVRFDAFADPVLTVSLITELASATAEAVLDGCAFGADPACVFDFTVTASGYPPGTGPLANDSFSHEDWRYHARLDDCTGRVTSTLTVEDRQGTAVSSEPLDLPGISFCPVICASP